MSDLIERLEKATGPDRELDAEIHAVARHWTDGDRPSPFYTASLDAAMTLVPSGLQWSVGNRDAGAWGSAMGKDTHWADIHVDAVSERAAEDGGFGCDTAAPNPALALCIAALKARITEPK